MSSFNPSKAILKFRTIYGSLSSKFAIFQRLIIIAIIVMFVAWLNFGFIVEILTSENSVKNKIEKNLSDILGQEAKVQGKVVFKTKPESYLELNDIRFGAAIEDRGEEEGEKISVLVPGEDKITISKIYTNPDLTAIAAGIVSFEKIIIENISAELYSNETSAGLVRGILDKLSQSDFFEDREIILKNLDVTTYKKSPLTDGYYIKRQFSFPELEILPNYQGVDLAYKGIFKDPNLDEEFYFQIGFDSNFSGGNEVKGKIYSNDSELSISGDSADLEIEGKVKSFNAKLFSFLGFSSGFINKVSLKDEASVSLNLDVKNDGIDLKNISVKSENIELSGGIKISGSSKVDVKADVKVNKLILPSLFKTETEMLSSKKVQEVENDYEKRLGGFALFSLGEDINIDAGIKLPKIQFFDNKSGVIDLDFKLEDNNLTINKAKFDLPGDTDLQIASKLAIDKQQKKLKGRLDFAFHSQNYYDFIKGLDLSDDPERYNGIGSVVLKSKGYLYERKLHFRKVAAKIKEDKLAGQMLIDYSKKFSASSAFNIPKFNLNHYLPIEADQQVKQELSADENFSKRLDFFRTIDSFFDELNLSISTNELIYKDNNLKDFSVFLSTSPGIINVKDSYFESDNFGVFRGKVFIDVTNFQPKVNFDVEVDNFDWDFIKYGKAITENDNFNFNGEWSKDRISLEQFLAYEGKASFKATSFKYRHFEGEDFKLDVDFLGDRIKINDSRLEIYGSKVDFKGQLTTEFPSFNMSFIAADLDAQQLLYNLFGIAPIKGKINASGILAASGLSFEEMAEKSKGKITLITKAIEVDGFDFNTLAKALPLVKRREQAEDVSLKLLAAGSTRYPTLTGVFTVANGKIKVDAINVQSSNTNNYKIKGMVDIVNWSLSLKSSLLLKTNDRMDVPLSSVTKGPMRSFKTEWDVKGATKYWEKKFYSGKI